MVVEHDAPSLKKNKNATNFYETIKATIFKSNFGGYFLLLFARNRILWNVEISQSVIKGICEYVTKYVKWMGMV